MINLHDVARELNDEPVAEPTPVEVLYRRANTLRRRTLAVRFGTGALAAGAAIVIAVALISTQHDNGVGTAPATQPTAPTAIGWPATFVSTRSDPNKGSVAVAFSDAHTGAVVKTIAEIPTTDGTTVTGTAITRDGHVWVTVDRGPKSRSNVNGGDPAPHSCASEVRDYDPDTGTYTTVLRGSDDELISDAQPNLAEDRVTYLHSGCATYFLDNAVEVRDLRTGDVMDMLPDLPRCHLIDNPRWSPSGDGLLYLYAPASGPTDDYRGPNGTCTDVGAATIQLEGLGPGVDSAESKVAGCSTTAFTASGSGYAAIEHCGPAPSFIRGYVHLVRYDAHLRAVSAIALGSCENGATIAGTTKSSDVIISMYQYCGGPSTPDPTTNVFVDSKAGLRKLLSIPGGDLAVGNVSISSP